MKHLIKTLPVILAAVVLGLGATVRHAAAEDTPKFEAAEQFISEKLANVAELSEDQRGKIQSLIREQFPALKTLVTRYVDQLRTLHETVGNVTVDEKTIRAEAAKLADVLVDYTKQRTQLAKSLQNVLTPDQLDKAQQAQRDVPADVARFVDEIAKRLAKP